MISNIILYCYYINTTFQNAKPFLFILVIAILIFIVSLFVLSIISFMTVFLIKINLAIKGKSYLGKQKNYNYAIKVLLIVSTTIIVLNGTQYLKQSYNILTTESSYLKNIKDLFNITYLEPQYMGYLEEIDLEKENQVKQYLAKENNYFELADLFTIDSKGNERLIYKVSKEYVDKNLSLETTEKLKDEKKYLLIPKEFSNQRDIILESLQQLAPYEVDEIILYPETELEFMIPYHYIEYGDTTLENILYIDNSLSSLGLKSFFTFNGNRDEAQKYYEEVSLKHGSKPLEYVESVKEKYVIEKAFFYQEFMIILPIFIMILIAILLNTCQLALLNCEINDKKYALLKSIGKSNFGLLIEELGIAAMLLLIAETILHLFMDISYSHLTIIIFVYLSVDILVFWIITSLKMKHFAERLR
jgi:hypothetical protein